MQGAAAVLEYNTVDSPLSQPRNIILGQAISTVIGIGITKLFLLSPHFESLRWLAVALSVGLASAAMGFTKTIHPPAGATALMAATTPEITELGWYLLPLIMLGSTLMLASACIVNNIQRTFPVYWWTPEDLSGKVDDIEKVLAYPESDVGTFSHAEYLKHDEPRVTINGDHIIIPHWLSLGDEEKAVLEVLRTRIRHGLHMTRTNTRGTLAAQRSHPTP